MTLFLEDPDFALHVGSAVDVLRTLPEESVHCVVTSPPYWGLRDYGTGTWEGGDPGCDHKQGRDGAGRADGIVDDRAQRNRDGAAALTRQECRCGARRVDQQLGLEPTPDEYVARMVEVFREVRRVLRSDGTCWLNLGDSYNAYNGNSKGGGPVSLTQSAERPKLPTGYGLTAKELKPKDLCGIPWRVAFALQDDGWYLRSDIIWAKPNPMPESVTDRPTKSHEYLFLLTRSARYFYDADAIREPAEWARWGDQTNGKHEGSGSSAGWIGNASKKDLQKKRGGGFSKRYAEQQPTHGAMRLDRPDTGAGRNARSVWEIATQPYAEAHFATFPMELPRRCIAAGTSEHGCCPKCGAPWMRIVEVEQEGKPDPNAVKAHGGIGNNLGGGRHQKWRDAHPAQTTGWRATCECWISVEAEFGYERISPPPVPCVVLDPFMGSGTTALVARKLGRRSVGIELNPEYASLAARRLQQQSLFA